MPSSYIDFEYLRDLLAYQTVSGLTLWLFLKSSLSILKNGNTQWKWSGDDFLQTLVTNNWKLIVFSRPLHLEGELKTGLVATVEQGML